MWGVPISQGVTTPARPFDIPASRGSKPRSWRPVVVTKTRTPGTPGPGGRKTTVFREPKKAERDGYLFLKLGLFVGILFGQNWNFTIQNMGVHRYREKKGIIGIINEEIGTSWDDLGYSYREHLMETPYIWEYFFLLAFFVYPFHIQKNNIFFELVSLVVIVLCPLFSRGDSRFNHQFLLVIWNPLLFQSMPQFCCLNSHSLWETYEKYWKWP